MPVAKLTAFGGGVVCPHCSRRAERPGRDIPDGIYRCSGCRKPFASRRLSDTIWYTESVGACPFCYSLTRLSLDGTVVSTHRNVYGRACPGVGRTARPEWRAPSILATA